MNRKKLLIIVFVYSLLVAAIFLGFSFVSSQVELKRAFFCIISFYLFTIFVWMAWLRSKAGLVFLILMGACFHLNLLEIANGNLENPQYNIFFIETNSSRPFFTIKELCAIESAAFRNPRAIVYVFSSEAQLDESSKLMLSKHYSNIRMLKLEPLSVFEQTPLLEWWLSGNVTSHPTHKTGHLSDAVRLALLYKYGGFYSDLDTITLRNLQPLSKYPASLGYLYETFDSIGNGFLHFRSGHELLLLAMQVFKKDYNPNLWSSNGPLLMYKVIRDYCQMEYDEIFMKLKKSMRFFRQRDRLDYLIEKKKLLSLNNLMNNEIETQIAKLELRIRKQNREQSCEVIIYPKEFIYPVSYIEEKYYLLFAANSSIDILTYMDSYSIHFFGKISDALKLKANQYSIYEYFAVNNCPIIHQNLLHS
jgi:hypothetical protein